MRSAEARAAGRGGQVRLPFPSSDECDLGRRPIAGGLVSFRDLLRDTLVTLWAQKRRTLLTMFGIAWGIISITVMVAAGEGLGDGIQKNQETFGKDVMIVFSGRTSMQAGGTRSGRLIHWMEDDYIEVAKETPACRYVMP